MGQELRERLERELPEPLALPEQPLLERGLVQGESGEEVAPIEGTGLREGVGRALGHPPLEDHHVDLDGDRVQCHRLVINAERRRIGRGEALPKHEDRLPDVVPGGLRPKVPPEQGGELVPGMGLAERQREIGQERLCLPRGEGHRSRRRPPRLKATEEGETETGHRTSVRTRA